MKKKPVSVKVPANIDRIYKEWSEKTGISKQDLVNEALRHSVKYDLEERTTRVYQIDERILKKIDKRTGKNKSLFIVSNMINFLIKKKLL